MIELTEFPVIASATAILDQLDEHRRRQALGFLFERFGWSLQPSAKKIMPAPNPNNRSEFAAIEEAADELDKLGREEKDQAVALVGRLRPVI